MKFLNMFYVIFVVVAYLTIIKSNEVPIVKIEQGVLSGKFEESFKGRSFAAFTGISFAKPPLGELRFQAPVPTDPWQDTFNATSTHNVCPQINIYDVNYPVIGHEDCLYLNIYTPKPTSEGNLLPVMFYIYGGSLEMGGAKPEWLGPKFLLDKDIVLVIPNYRLGALGFLSTGDEIVPGNNGLKDQNLALKWTHKNIVKFGGDPNKITIFGNSAGGLSSHLHTVSPISSGLINRAILQSGSAVASFAVDSLETAKKNSNKLGELLTCSTASSTELISCLRGVDASEIIQQSTKFNSWDSDSTLPFRPVIDGEFLIESPVESIKKGKTSNISYIIGVAAQEAAYKVAYFNAKPSLLQVLNKMFNVIIPPTFGIASDKLNSSERIRNFYFGDKEIDSDAKLELTNMYSDGFFVYPHSIAVSLHAKFTNSPVYQYLFDYRGSSSYADLFGDQSVKYGACHTDELFHLYSLGHTFPNYAPTENDIKVMEVMTTMWTNFAATGNPTSESGLLNLTKWEPISNEGLEYYHIKNYNDLKMETGLYSNRTDFWKTLPILSL